eukprot:TRINITY_DN3299_c0_g1_i5.p1 TRINITY_DN3299_c0_g1~~TRINITY_DN3299_c0_g1_i5.p1  ORF type:complete len:144 (-),score=49.95 TRINITY_DN3299_c0_g1_i5:80-511(-)
MEPSKLLAQRDIYGNTSLHLAALYQASDIAKVLVDSGAIPDTQNNSGESALEIARGNGCRKMVQLLERRDDATSPGTGRGQDREKRLEDVDDEVSENIPDDSQTSIGHIHEECIGARVQIKTENLLEKRFLPALILANSKCLY